MRVAYRQIPDLLSRKRPFKGNSMRAAWEGPEYCVYSYATMIAKAQPTPGGFLVWVSDGVWSKTTSRQQGLCRAWL